jgi:nucleoside-diphosphate-sugar epimerase
MRRSNIADRLCDSLQVDITKTTDLLDWKPTPTIKMGIEKMVHMSPLSYSKKR